MKILKFGGTSVQDAEAMRRVAEIVAGCREPVLVVLSATAGTTNQLLQMVDLAAQGHMEEASALKKEMEKRHLEIIKQLGLEKDRRLKNEITRLISTLEILLIGIYYLREATPRVRDAVAAHGELFSTHIFAAYFRRRNPQSRWFDIREVMLTDNQFGEAQPNRERLQQRAEEQLRPLLEEGNTVITQGFIGRTGDGLVTTLGRGGSDYTAALLGHALNAEVIEIWTDVSGIMTVDPRLVSTARTQRELSFKEAAELAYFGAKVLHPSTIQPAMEKRIPVVVKNTLTPEDPGTTIVHHSSRPGEVKAIAFRQNVTMLTVESTRMLMAYGFLERIFEVFARHRISIDLISTSEISVSLTLDNGVKLEQVLQELGEFSRVEVKTGMSIISLVGENIKESPGFLARVFSTLKDFPIEMISFGASNVNLSLVTPDKNLKESVVKLHRVFFEG